MASLACAAIGSYSITSAHDLSVGNRSVPITGGISVEPREPNFIMPESCTCVHHSSTSSGVYEYNTTDAKVVYL